ncbi:hypothetical protein ACJJIG_17365 [Microbulbifer sp. SSSA007]|uniref:hypothetical protein n=1 Tax=Microbulbifer sp. SSSA007 TaxID=3243379 RepID=UPI004039C0DD
MTEKNKILGGKALFDAMMEDSSKEAEIYEKIKIDDDHLVLNFSYEYTIPLSELQSHTQVLSWVLHLSEKTWIEKDHLIAFIRAANKAAGLPELNP